MIRLGEPVCVGSSAQTCQHSWTGWFKTSAKTRKDQSEKIQLNRFYFTNDYFAFLDILYLSFVLFSFLYGLNEAFGHEYFENKDLFILSLSRFKIQSSICNWHCFTTASWKVKRNWTKNKIPFNASYENMIFVSV